MSSRYKRLKTHKTKIWKTHVGTWTHYKAVGVMFRTKWQCVQHLEELKKAEREKDLEYIERLKRKSVIVHKGGLTRWIR